MLVQFSQIQDIILKNPNKELISNAKTQADKLMMHVFGRGLNDAISQYGYFENKEIYDERKAGAISNKDLFARLLQREEMVWTAQGGASYYEGLSDSQTIGFDAVLESIRFNQSIRSWVKEFALNAYRTDPMSLLFIEVSTDGKIAYPTYKSIACIYDYQTTGRKVEYVCFRLTAQDCYNFGVDDPSLSGLQSQQYTIFYRFVDDSFDYILKNDNGIITQYSMLVHPFKVVPAIVASDLIDFSDTRRFETPLKDVVELADCFLVDRSVRNLQKKYSGFAKAFEPLLKCGTCNGTGYLSAAACPTCTIPGHDRGTGYKLQTKVADVVRFPLDSDNQIDPTKFFGYVSPPIDIWDKQDTSLNDLESQMDHVYWGSYETVKTTGPQVGDKSVKKTATETLANLQPSYARLNKTADWAEDTENALCNLLGGFYYQSSFKQSVRTYGRYYILETPDELMDQYLNEKAKGAPQVVLNETLKKYYHSLYSDNKIMLAVQLKLMSVEPFVHYTAVQAQAMNPAKVDIVQKVYFSEWLAAKDQSYLIVTSEEAMQADLLKFANAKIALAPELIAEPTVGITENVRNTQ